MVVYPKELGYGVVFNEKANPECQAVLLVIFLWKTTLEVVISTPRSSWGWMPQADSYLRPFYGWESPRWAHSRSYSSPQSQHCISQLFWAWCWAGFTPLPQSLFPVSSGIYPVRNWDWNPKIKLLSPPRVAQFWLSCSPSIDLFAASPIPPGAGGSILFRAALVGLIAG